MYPTEHFVWLGIFSFRVLFSNLSIIFFRLKQNTLHLARCFLLYNSYLSFPFVDRIVAVFGCRCKWKKLLLKQLNINIIYLTRLDLETRSFFIFTKISKAIFFSFSLTSALPRNNKIKQTLLSFGLPKGKSK